jgi:hypothetical protein
MPILVGNIRCLYSRGPARRRHLIRHRCRDVRHRPHHRAAPSGRAVHARPAMAPNASRHRACRATGSGLRRHHWGRHAIRVRAVARWGRDRPSAPDRPSGQSGRQDRGCHRCPLPQRHLFPRDHPAAPSDRRSRLWAALAAVALLATGAGFATRADATTRPRCAVFAVVAVATVAPRLPVLPVARRFRQPLCEVVRIERHRLRPSPASSAMPQ